MSRLKRSLFNKLAVVAIVVLVFSGVGVLANVWGEETIPLRQTIDNIIDKIVGYRLPFLKFGVVKIDPSVTTNVGCKKILNDGTGNKEYFIPTKTATEWGAFREAAGESDPTNSLEGISLDSCSMNLPAGAISFFDTATCPDGWSEQQNGVARGRYLVANVGGAGDLGTITGTALNQGTLRDENRAVGAHSNQHVLSDPGHSHVYLKSKKTKVDNKNETYFMDDSFVTANMAGKSGISMSEAIPIYSGDVVDVPGTPAPYTQFLICQKD